MTRPAKTFLRSRALPDVSRAAVCIAALAAAFVLTARAEAQPNLADGLEILSLYRTADPRIQQAFDQLMDRVPEDVRARVRASTFSEQRSQMTAGQLAEAVKDDTLRVIPTDQGLAAVPLDKIRNGIQGLTDFIIDLPELPAMIEEHKQRLPEGARSQIPLLVAAARNGIPFARDSIHIAVLDAATTMVDEAQRKIREQIGRDGAEAVLREARNRAAARTASAAGPARPQDPQQPPPLTREQIDQLMVDVPRLIDDADRLWEGVTNIVGQCQNAVNDIAASTVPPDAFADAVAQNNRRKAAAETAMQQAERVIATSAQALRPSVTQAQNASTAACADPKGPSAAANRGLLGAARATARGTYDGLKPQLDAALAQLGTPVVASALSALDAQLAGLQNSCTRNEAVLASIAGARHPDDVFWTSREVAIRDAIDQIAGAKSAPSLDIELLRYRWARTLSRINAMRSDLGACLRNLEAQIKGCRHLPTLAADISQVVAAGNKLEQRRRDIRNRVNDALTQITNDFAAVTTAVDKGLACIDPPPPPPVQTGCNQADIDSAFGAAQADYHAERHDAAGQKLKDILKTLGRCPGVPDRVTRAEDLIHKVRTNTTKVNDAIAQCNIELMERSAAQIAGLRTPHPAYVRLAAAMRAAISSCKRVEEAGAACELKHGKSSRPYMIGPDPAAQCVCATTGSVIESGTCDGPPVAPIVAATPPPGDPPIDRGNAACRDKSGPQAFAYGFRAGSYTCGCLGAYTMIDGKCRLPQPADRTTSLPPPVVVPVLPRGTIPQVRQPQPTAIPQTQPLPRTTRRPPPGQRVKPPTNNRPQTTPRTNTRQRPAPVRRPPVQQRAAPPQCGAGCRLTGARYVNGQWIGGHCVCPRGTFGPKKSAPAVRRGSGQQPRPPVVRRSGACNSGFVRNRNGMCVPNLGKTLDRLRGVMK